MDGRRSFVWAGALLIVVGLATVLIFWIGWAHANLYLGVPAALAAVLGLALTIYGLRSSRPDLEITQLVRGVRSRNIVVIGEARQVSCSDPDAGSAFSQQISGTEASGDVTVIGSLNIGDEHDRGELT